MVLYASPYIPITSHIYEINMSELGHLTSRKGSPSHFLMKFELCLTLVFDICFLSHVVYCMFIVGQQQN